MAPVRRYTRSALTRRTSVFLTVDCREGGGGGGGLGAEKYGSSEKIHGVCTHTTN